MAGPLNSSDQMRRQVCECADVKAKSERKRRRENVRARIRVIWMMVSARLLERMVLNASLVSGHYMVANGSFDSIKKVITDGVPQPHGYEVPMPPKGGAPLTDSDITAVATYVWAIGHAAHPN